VVIDFAGAERAARVEREAAAVALETPAIERVEAWGVADARRVYADGRVRSSFILFGVPPTTRIAPFAEREGRWLAAATPAEALPDLYINYEAEKLTAGPAVGETLNLKLNGLRETSARLVGISLRPFNANAYLPYATFERAT